MDPYPSNTGLMKNYFVCIWIDPSLIPSGAPGASTAVLTAGIAADPAASQDSSFSAANSKGDAEFLNSLETKYQRLHLKLAVPASMHGSEKGREETDSNTSRSSSTPVDTILVSHQTQVLDHMLYMTVVFWYLVKLDLSSECYCTVTFQGTRITRPCLSGRAVHI